MDSYNLMRLSLFWYIEIYTIKKKTFDNNSQLQIAFTFDPFMFVHSLLIHVNAYIKFLNEPKTTYHLLWLVAAFIPKNDRIISNVLRNKKERYNAGKSMHHQCVKGLLFFSHRRYIEAARGQHFSRDEASKPQLRTLYRHTEIDRRRFFSPGPEDETREKQPVHRRNKERTRGTKTKRKWAMRPAVRTRVSTRSVAWAIPAPLFRSVVFRVALFLTAEIYICRQGRPLFLPIGLIVRGDDRD